MTIGELTSKLIDNTDIIVKAEKPHDQADDADTAALIEFQSVYWDSIDPGITDMEVNGIAIGNGFKNACSFTVYVDAESDNEQIQEELLVGSEDELADALHDDEFERIRLAANIKINSKLTIYDYPKIIDLAGYSIHQTQRSEPVFFIGEDAELAITGCGNVSGFNNLIKVVDGGKLTIEGGIYSNYYTTADMIAVVHGRAKILDGVFMGWDPSEFINDGFRVEESDADGDTIYTVLPE